MNKTLRHPRTFFDLKVPVILFATILALLAGILVVGLNASTFLFIIIIISILNLVFSFGLIKVSKGFSLAHITITGYAFLAYVIIINIPSLIVVLGDIQNPVLLLLWKAIQGSTFLFALGVVYSNLLFKLNDEEVADFFNRPIKFDAYEGVFLKIAQYGLILSIVIMGFYFYKYWGRVPLFYLVTHPGDTLAITLLREDTSKVSLRFWEGYLIEWGRALILPTLMSMSFVIWRLGKQKRWRNWFILYLALAVFFASLSTAKFPVVMVFVILTVTYLAMAGTKEILKKTPLFIILIFLYPLFERMLKYSVGFWDAVTFILWERIFVVPIEALTPYFEYFPLLDGYLGGRSIRLLSLILGKTYFNTANYVYILKGTSPIDTGLANGAFIGNLYADFGMTGVLIGAFLIGFFLQWVQITFFRREKNVFSVAIYAFFVVLFMKIAIVPFPSLLLGGGGLVAWFAFLIFTPRSSIVVARDGK
jgi:oligosaccharide repeat unit polymerase